MMKQILNDFLHSDWMTVFYSSGWFCAILVSTKFGNNILVWLKHIWYSLKNPPIIYSASFNFEFYNIDILQINNLVESIYKSKILSKYKLTRNGQYLNNYKLHYPGLDYLFEIEDNAATTNLIIKIKETESNYNNLNNHIRKIIIESFMKDLVLSEILRLYNTSQFESKYQFNLRFSEKKYNFFLKERFTKIPKGYVSNALITIKDTNDENFILDADLNGLSICVKDDFDKFLKMFKKYISIL